MPSVPKDVFHWDDPTRRPMADTLIASACITNEPSKQATDQPTIFNLFCSRPTCYMDLPGLYTNQTHSGPKLLQADQSLRCSISGETHLILVVSFGYVWFCLVAKVVRETRSTGSCSLRSYIRSKGSEHFLGAELKLMTEGGEELKGELYCVPWVQPWVLWVSKGWREAVASSWSL